MKILDKNFDFIIWYVFMLFPLWFLISFIIGKIIKDVF